MFSKHTSQLLTYVPLLTLFPLCMLFTLCIPVKSYTSLIRNQSQLLPMVSFYTVLLESRWAPGRMPGMHGVQSVPVELSWHKLGSNPPLCNLNIVTSSSLDISKTIYCLFYITEQILKAAISIYLTFACLNSSSDYTSYWWPVFISV